jgi:hypothetical protein
LVKKGATMKIFSCFLLAALLCNCNFALAHLGSPGVNYQGKAGNYNILVNIKPPDVIPGIAAVSIFIENYKNEKVSVQAFYYDAGKNGSVPAEMATPINGASGWFENSCWLMWRGSASLKIIISGNHGIGSVNIPVMAEPTANRQMPIWLGLVLGTFGLLLIFLMIAMVSCGVSDALLIPGAVMPQNMRRRKLRGILITIVAITIGLYCAYRWYSIERGNYLTTIYKPIKGSSAIFKYNGETVLRLHIDSASLNLVHQPFEYIVPDHGKLMHLVLVKQNTFNAFAHLHPIRQNAYNFLVNLPPLLPGNYFLYADVVSGNGFAETIIDTVKIPANPGSIVADSLKNVKIITSPDDAWLISNPVTNTPSTNTGKPVSVCGLPGTSFMASDGSIIEWEHTLNEPFKANKFSSLAFQVLNKQGKPAILQPYMGMMGHAIVVKYDGSVYVHLHPIGNFAMASQQAVNKRMLAVDIFSQPPNRKKFKDSIDHLVQNINNMTEDQRNDYLMVEMGMKKSVDKGMNMDMTGNNNSMDGANVQFPYAFPNPGKYRIWVEVKINNKIITGTFDAIVN